jgi:hypothetical protein
VAIAHDRPVPPASAVVHRMRRHELIQTTHNPWPVTTLNGLSTHCARTMPFPESLAMTDSALRRKLVNSDTLEGFALRVLAPGAALVRQVFRAADGRSASIGESFARAAALDAGVPPRELQYPMQLPDGSIRPANMPRPAD